MKVLCIDTFTDGHHCSYMNGINNIENVEFRFVLPKSVKDILNRKQNIIEYDTNKRSLQNDMRWIKNIREIIADFNPNIIHFLYGDYWYRYFGLQLKQFKKAKTIMTFHVVPNDFKHKVSVQRIASKISYCIVHTEKLYKQFLNWGIKNVVHIEYPCFFPVMQFNKKQLRKEFNIEEDKIVFAALGGTRKYKGLDFLLEAMNGIKGNYQLLIAGSEEFFTKEYINEKIKPYSDSVTLKLKQLTNMQFIKAIAVSDWIVLPYRKDFMGASGPLAEGVMYNKRILGTNSGSIGEIIMNNDLGYTFESENIDDLRKKLQLSINDNSDFSDRYINYRNNLKPETFKKKYYQLYTKLTKCNGGANEFK